MLSKLVLDATASGDTYPDSDCDQAAEPDQPYWKSISKRSQLLVFVSIYLSIFCLIRYSPVWNYVPRISVQFSSLSTGLSNHIPGVRYQDPGWIRPCSAPQPNLWSTLSEDEVEIVLQTIESRKSDIGIKHDFKIVFMERLMPNKTEVLSSLENKANIDKWARVVIYQREDWGGSRGAISEWMVGPISKIGDLKIAPLNYVYNSNRNHVKRPIPDIVEVLLWLDNIIIGELNDMILDLVGQAPNFVEMAKEPGLMSLSTPVTKATGGIAAWLTVYVFNETSLRDAFSLTPQGLYAHLDIEGMRPENWFINGWYYNGILYNSTNSIYQEWKRGRIKKTLPNKDGQWTHTEPDAKGIRGRELLGPVLVQPNGPRVEVDAKEQFVSWMGWELYFSFSQVTSLSLYNIKFRGERIIYEVGLQEALAHYAGGSPSMAGQAFFDTLFGFGGFAYELVPGYDCPSYATFLPAKFYRNGENFERKNAICIFEAVSDHALQRHTTTARITVSKNSYLVIRTVSTLGNYDYTVSILYLDGSIEVKVHASGYIFTDYMALDDMRKDLAQSGETQLTEYGYRIHDVVVSSMHTHQLLFKADLDIAGTNNTLYKVAVEPVQKKYSFEDQPRNTMHLIHSPIEKEAGLEWTPNSQNIYVLLNNASENMWGEKRGYKIVPGTGMGTPPHLAVINSTAIGKAAQWSYHNLWVLKQHDQELRATSEWNGWEVDDPLIDFSKMVNDESTVQDDLVVYFNLGVHHLSNSQDVPNTLMHWSGTSVMFVPHNYFERDPSRESAQGLKLERGKAHGETIVTYYGAKYDKDILLDKKMLDPVQTGYVIPDDGIGALSMNITWSK